MAFWVLVVNAAPIVYSSAQYDTVAVAIAGGEADFNSGSSPPADMPLLTSATAFDAVDYASGSGVAAIGLLTTQAEANSFAGIANAVGTSEFTGVFSLDPLLFLQISIDMTSQHFTDAAAFSSGTLFLVVTSGGTTFLDEQLSTGGLYSYSLGPVAAGSYTLNLQLSSEANTTSGGNAFNFASVAFEATVSAVPEPGTLLLWATAGIVWLLWSQRRVAAGRQWALIRRLHA